MGSQERPVNAVYQRHWHLEKNPFKSASIRKFLWVAVHLPVPVTTMTVVTIPVVYRLTKVYVYYKL